MWSGRGYSCEGVPESFKTPYNRKPSYDCEDMSVEKTDPISRFRNNLPILSIISTTKRPSSEVDLLVIYPAGDTTNSSSTSFIL